MTAGDVLRDQALDAVEQAADDAWLRACRLVVGSLVRQGVPFSTDDCWARLTHVHTSEPRAMGAVIRAFKNAGLITPSGRYVKSDRPEAHSRPVCMWVPVR